MNISLELIGLIVTIFGVFLTLWQVYKVREAMLFDKLREMFFNICTTPQYNIIPLEKIYQAIIKFYQTEIDKHPDYRLIDKEYFYRCFRDIITIRFLKEDSCYDFPLITQDEYLLSRNNKLSIQRDSFDYDRIEHDNILDDSSKEFLGKLGIQNLSSFILKGKTMWDQCTFDVYNAHYNKEAHTLNLNFMRGSYFQYVNRNELWLFDDSFGNTFFSLILRPKIFLSIRV